MAAALAMAPVLGNGFLAYDDGIYVTENLHVRAGLTLEGFTWAWTTTRAGNWHPLTWLSHMLDWQLWGDRAGGHHLTSLLFHAANTLLLFVVLERASGQRGPSAAVAALFAVHPLHVESVAWIAERKDVLSTFFGLLATGVYVRWVRERGAGRRIAVALLFAASLCAKPMLVTLPFVFLLLDVWPLGRRPRESWVALVREKLPLFALAAASCAVTLFAQSRGGAVWSLEDLSLQVRLPGAIVAYVTYLGRTIWPLDLAILYPHPGTAPSLPVAALAAALLAVVMWLALRERVRRPHLLVGWLWYVGTLVPVIGLVQVGPQATADRYTYVPLIGLFIAIVWEAARYGQRVRRWRTAIFVVLLLLLGVLAFRHAGRFEDSETLLEHTLRVTERNTLAAILLSSALQEQGRHEQAVSWGRRAVEMSPGAAWPRRALGAALQAAGRPAEAIDELAEALRIEPADAEAHNEMGVALSRLGRTLEALASFRRALDLRPGYLDAMANLGSALILQGDVEAALLAFEDALRLDPDHAAARTKLGLALAERGDLDGALGHLTRVLEARPGHVEARQHRVLVLYLRGEHERARAELRALRRAGAEPDPRLVRLLEGPPPAPVD